MGLPRATFLASRLLVSVRLREYRDTINLAASVSNMARDACVRGLAEKK